jgi:hypothetical protein
VAEQPEIMQQFQNYPNMTPQLLRTAFFAAAGLAVVAGVLLAVLAAFVRRANKAAIVMGMVISILAVGYFLLSLVTLLARGVSAGAGPQFAGAICMAAVPLALFALLLSWLIAALRSSGQVEAAQQQYAQQYWQYAYQQQAYNRPGGTMPPVPPPGGAFGAGGIPTHGGFPPPPGYQPPPQPPQPPPPPPGDSSGPSAQG